MLQKNTGSALGLAFYWLNVTVGWFVSGLGVPLGEVRLFNGSGGRRSFSHFYSRNSLVFG